MPPLKNQQQQQAKSSRLQQRANAQRAFFGNHHRVGAIRPFLANQAFDPETIRHMSLALERVCETLVLRFKMMSPREWWLRRL
jgi:hypothetical protein